MCLGLRQRRLELLKIDCYPFLSLQNCRYACDRGNDLQPGTVYVTGCNWPEAKLSKISPTIRYGKQKRLSQMSGEEVGQRGGALKPTGLLIDERKQ